MRSEIERKLEAALERSESGIRAAEQDLAEWLKEEPGLSEAGARQLADYFGATYRALGVIPSQDKLVLERFFDESGGMQLVIHSPFGMRLNRGLGAGVAQTILSIVQLRVAGSGNR